MVSNAILIKCYEFSKGTDKDLKVALSLIEFMEMICRLALALKDRRQASARVDPSLKKPRSKIYNTVYAFMEELWKVQTNV